MSLQPRASFFRTNNQDRCFIKETNERLKMSCNSRPEPTSEKKISRKQHPKQKVITNNSHQHKSPLIPGPFQTGHQALVGHRVQAHVQGLRFQVLRPPTARDSPGIRRDPTGTMEFVHLFHGEITPKFMAGALPKSSKFGKFTS